MCVCVCMSVVLEYILCTVMYAQIYKYEFSMLISTHKILPIKIKQEIMKISLKRGLSKYLLVEYN